MTSRAANIIPQLVPLRARRAKERIDALVWTGWRDVTVRGGPVNADPIPLDEATRQALAPIHPGAFFGPPGGGWQQRWFEVQLSEPTVDGEHLHWLCQGEATAYIDRRPWAGLDFSHPSCRLPSGTRSLWIDHGTYATGIAPTKTPGIGPHGCRFDGARVARRNEVPRKIGWDLDVLLALAAQLFADGRHEVADNRYGYQATLDRCSPLLRLLLQGLDDACEAFDHQGLPAFNAALDALFARLPAEAWQPQVAICPQTHIDLVWLWPEREAERKAVHSMASMMRLLDEYPDFVFSASQPAMYRALERRAPTLSAEIQARIDEGRWEATGAFEVEPDTQIPCGEALARSLVLGQRKLSALRGGVANRLCWLPDVFGYAACLPTVLRLAGVPWFFTTKLRWSALTKFPYQSFVWRGADGSEVLAQISTIGYTGVSEVEPLVTAAREYSQHGVHDEFLLAQGLGDGGGGPTEGMLERTRRFANLSGLPRARFAKAEEFFDRLETARDRLPVYQGELYLEYHRGTYTSQGEFKRRYRELERALQTREAVRVVSGAGPIEEEPWQRLAFGQFHDALPGTSIGLVYEQLGPELESLAQAQLNHAASELAGATAEIGTAPAIFNPLALPRTILVAQGTALVAINLPALGAVRFDATTTPAQLPPMREVSPRVLDNGIVRVSFDEFGQPIRFEGRDETLVLAAPAGLRLYVDEPAKFGAWDIDHQALRHPTAAPFNEGLSVEQSGPMRAVLRGTTPIGARSHAEIRYRLDAGSPWLQVELVVDWREDNRLLKYHLPTAHRGRFARFGGPFGSVLRTQQAGVLADEAMWEIPGSRWAAVTDDAGRGMALVAEARYGFSCRDGDLGLSLLRAPGDPDPKADRGVHRIRFAFGAHRPHITDDRLSTAAAAESLFTPPLAFEAKAALPEPPLQLHGLGSLVPAWVLPAADGGFVVRLHETAGDRGRAEVVLRDQPGGIDLVDFLESPLPDQLPLQKIRDRSFALAYQPYQILSVRVRPT